VIQPKVVFPIVDSFHVYLALSDFFLRNTLLIPPMSLKLIRLFDLAVRLDCRLSGSLIPEALLGLGEIVTTLVAEFGLEPKYDDARRPVGLVEVTVVVVVVVVGP